MAEIKISTAPDSKKTGPHGESTEIVKVILRKGYTLTLLGGQKITGDGALHDVPKSAAERQRQKIEYPKVPKTDKPAGDNPGKPDGQKPEGDKPATGDETNQDKGVNKPGKDRMIRKTKNK
jgi:hypothetical protein